MKVNSKSKFEIMSQSLRLFKQIPQILQHFADSYTHSHLAELVKCSNKFVELANSGTIIQTDISLFHRFFCRLREIIYSSLNYYLHTHSFVFIRQLLVEINKQILLYKPGTGYENVLVKISQTIIESVSKIAKSKQINNKQISQILQCRVQYKPYAIQAQPVYHYHSQKKKVLQNENQSINSKSSTQESMTKMLGYDPLGDIQISFLQKIPKSATSDQLYNDCLHRNRFISFLIKKYEEKHKAYQNKPEHRKNRNPADYCPTEYAKYYKSQGKQFKVGNRKYHIQFTKQSPSPSPEKRLNFIRSKPSLMAETLQPKHFDQFDNDFTKQEILMQSFAYREKYKLNKVMIGTKQFELKTSDKQMKTTKNFYKTPKPKSHRQNSRNNVRNGSRSERMRTINNRTYFSGIMSIPLREKY